MANLALCLIHIFIPLSACPEAFFFPRTPINTQHELACSQLDDSFLPGGMIRARCFANGTWGPLDMSQCTFRSDASVAAVAVVEFIMVNTSKNELDAQVNYII